MRVHTLLLVVASAVVAAPLQAQERARWSSRDMAIFGEKLQLAQRRRVDTLPLGEAIAVIGLSFVGTPYEAATLEQPGPERLVVNLHGLDCVTFVESVLAITWLAREHPHLLSDPSAARARYEQLLQGIRYRGGVIDGYASRLHYFTEWLAQGVALRRWELVTESLGGVPTWQVIDFMSSHRALYPALADPAQAERMALLEARLSADAATAVLPKGWIVDSVVARIQTGDIIAATAARPGLDVVHTGFAVRQDGVLRLLHAPLAGGTVEVSSRPLAERLQRLRAQAGIIVARPHAMPAPAESRARNREPGVSSWEFAR
jgi:hypothetical protein